MTAYRYVFLGLPISGPWIHGYATACRALLAELSRRGHDVLFLERDLPFSAEPHDAVAPSAPRVDRYGDAGDLRRRFQRAVREADLVVVGSYLPDGVEIGAWVTEIAPGRAAFYDIDTPVTLARLERGEEDHIAPALIHRYDLYLSFTGGPTLDLLARRFGARCARPLYGSVDPTTFFPEPVEPRWDLGYLGDHSPDARPALERLLLDPARRSPQSRFLIAGARYPAQMAWPANVDHRALESPADRRALLSAQRFTLDLARRDLALAGCSPSMRLFEAAATGVPVISDAWPGLDAFFTPGHEILVARTPEDTLGLLRELSEQDRFAIGRRARARVLAAHTPAHRADALVAYTTELIEKKRARAPAPAPSTRACEHFHR
ncbi:Hypothetical protein A7982_01061 [Minicystis rosea]|nr:Hypothetical protein A7982_01061 [Minicystis rosea]